jgi:GxxExxY protein
LESAYEDCPCFELGEHALPYRRQVTLPVAYKSRRLESGFRIDVLVEDGGAVELKAVEQVLPVHEAQLLTYLKLGKFPVGLLLNFHVPVLKQGIERLVLS